MREETRTSCVDGKKLREIMKAERILVDRRNQCQAMKVLTSCWHHRWLDVEMLIWKSWGTKIFQAKLENPPRFRMTKHLAFLKKQPSRFDLESVSQMEMWKKLCDTLPIIYVIILILQNFYLPVLSHLGVSDGQASICIRYCYEKHVSRQHKRVNTT